MSHSPRRLRVIFVAGLDPVAGGGAGGQLTVASTLLHSELAQHVDFIPLSSTTKSIPPPSLARRATYAGARVARFAYSVTQSDVAMIFPSGGPSVVEKGLMAWMARAAGRGVVMRFGSGVIERLCRTKPAMRRAVAGAISAAHVLCVQSARWGRFYEEFEEARGKIVEIPNGVRLKPVATKPPTHGRAPGIIYVGWMDRDKGIFDVLEAFHRISASLPNTRLVMVGGGRDQGAFCARAEELGLLSRITMAGWVDHDSIHRLLSECDIFVLPSRSEGLPNAMLEAMAAKLPVVVSPVGGIPDVVRDGEQGFLVPPGDGAGLARAFQCLLDNPQLAETMGAAGRRIIEQRFDVERVWPLYRAAIERAAAEAKRRPSV